VNTDRQKGPLLQPAKDSIYVIQKYTANQNQNSHTVSRSNTHPYLKRTKQYFLGFSLHIGQCSIHRETCPFCLKMSCTWFTNAFVPAAIPTDPRTLRLLSRAFSNYRTLSDWNKSSHGRTLHSVYFNPLQWRHWYEQMDRHEAVSVSRFLSDHFPCRSYLLQFGLSSSDDCRFCHAASETPQHLLLLHCPCIATDSAPYSSIFSSPPSAPLTQDLLLYLASQIRIIEDCLRASPLIA